MGDSDNVTCVMCAEKSLASEAVQQSQVSSSNPTVSDILGPLLLQVCALLQDDTVHLLHSRHVHSGHLEFSGRIWPRPLLISFGSDVFLPVSD